MRFRSYVAVCAAALMVSGCGGDDSNNGGSGSTVPPANSAPVFTSGASTSVLERSAGVFYTATATDADGDPLSYSIAGGPDAARFALAANGALEFVAIPDFSTPEDSNGDNVYQVTVQVSDGHKAVQLELNVSVTDVANDVAVRRISVGLNDPVAIAPIAGAGALLVVERDGGLFEVTGATGAINSLGSLVSLFGLSSDSKIMALAARPDYVSSRRFMVMVQTVDGYVFVREFTNDNGVLRGSSYGEGLGRNQDYSAANTGWLTYADNDTAYALITSGSGTTSTGDAAQDPNSLLGKAVKIVRFADPYAGASPMFFNVTPLASGLREPNGGALINGELVFADSGRTVFEEINRLTLPASSPANFGWPYSEGTEILALGGPANTTPPVLQYARGTGVRSGSGVVGGQVYSGSIPSLSGRYVFGDRSGAIWTIPFNSLAGGAIRTGSNLELRTADFTPDAGAINSPVAFVKDAAGVLYVLDTDGELFRVDRR